MAELKRLTLTSSIIFGKFTVEKGFLFFFFLALVEKSGQLAPSRNLQHIQNTICLLMSCLFFSM